MLNNKKQYYDNFMNENMYYETLINSRNTQHLFLSEF